VGTLGDAQPVTVGCQVWGEEIEGTQRRTPYWNRIGDGRFISDAFVAWTPSRPEVPWCGADFGAASVATVGADVLNVRSGPGVGHGVIGQLPGGTAISARCQAWGSSVEGDSAWLQTGDGAYVSAYFVRWAPEKPWLPWCGQASPDINRGGTAGFVAAWAGPAQEIMRAYRVPASVSIAQAILESSWGRSTLTRDDHNYFGRKCIDGPGPVAMACRDYPTHECAGNACWATRALFRAYRNAADSYVDHGRQLTELSRYAEAMNHTHDPDRFAREIHKAGYATGSTYADKVIDLMRRYDLYKYDRIS
jgi:flagellar protein FlgJ